MKNMTKIYERICPKCGKKIIYKSYGGWHLSTKKNCLCRKCASYLRLDHYADLSVLLEDTPEAFYWIGFLMADGSFIHNKRLSLSLAIKDKDHLLKFVEFIKFKGVVEENLIKCSIKVQDIKIVPKIMKKFSLVSNKTYNPPILDFTYFERPLFLSLLAGFIDGDGNISHQNKRRDFFLRIKCHSSWLPILKQFETLIGDFNKCKINNQGYAIMAITNTSLLQDLKEKLLALNIPLMKRKWDIIDLKFVSKYTKAKILNNKIVKELISNSLSYKELSIKYNTSIANIYQIKKRNNL